MTDTIHRFIFDTFGIRGELVKLSDSSQQMISAHQYPPLIAKLLQQAAAVNVLLATTLKFEGKISIQLQTPGELKMLVVQSTDKLGYRGVARYDQQADYSQMSFKDITNNGQMCITIEPLKGQRYQGIVALEGNDLAQCGCSQEKMLDSICLINQDEIKEILDDEGAISVTCEFCLYHFAFAEIDIKKHQGYVGNSILH